MTAALDTIIPALAAASILTALFFVWRALGNRNRSSKAAYGVAHLEARQAWKVDIARGAAAGLVGLILLAIVGLSPAPAEPEPVATLSPSTRPPATETPEPLAPSPTVTSAAETPIRPEPETPTPSAGSPSPSPPTPTSLAATETSTVTPTASPTPEPTTATVASGVGVWLRSVPSTEGEQLEWLLDGTILVLLPGTATADDLQWQEVRAPTGAEGWVAADFIIYNR